MKWIAEAEMVVADGKATRVIALRLREDGIAYYVGLADGSEMRRQAGAEMLKFLQDDVPDFSVPHVTLDEFLNEGGAKTLAANKGQWLIAPRVIEGAATA